MMRAPFTMPCATEDEIIEWAYASTPGVSNLNVARDVFCGEADPAWCRMKREQGQCCRTPQWQRWMQERTQYSEQREDARRRKRAATMRRVA